MAQKQTTHTTRSSAVVVPSSHLKSLHLENLGVFEKELFSFSPHLNLIIGENGTGKSHLLKFAYSAMAASVEGFRKHGENAPTKQVPQSECADKIRAVFKPETLGHLVNTNLNTKHPPHKTGEIKVAFFDGSLDFAVQIKAGSKFDDQKLRQRIRAIDPHVNVWGVSEQGIPWSVEKIK